MSCNNLRSPIDDKRTISTNMLNLESQNICINIRGRGRDNSVNGKNETQTELSKRITANEENVDYSKSKSDQLYRKVYITKERISNANTNTKNENVNKTLSLNREISKSSLSLFNNKNKKSLSVYDDSDSEQITMRHLKTRLSDKTNIGKLMFNSRNLYVIIHTITVAQV